MSIECELEQIKELLKYDKICINVLKELRTMNQILLDIKEILSDK